ncbi:hypothetical protein BXZ70DRAFT_1011519 [Cristinia sonorae]|uniref:DUF6534 domain-containing protein n=1 Tax=Cristinia sonorae TaxID=1940300 RepID=A0A8K0UG83_9AGAR|nr:hypothetical protein BXZ70DRAFT_1011519 [Cristinia sonorae]
MSNPADDVHPVGTALTLITGPMIMAHLVNWCLLGVLTVQVYAYHLAFPNDHYANRLVVTVAFFLELGQIFAATYDAFRVFGSGWGNYTELNSVGIFWVHLVLLTGMVTTLCQCFYAWRIYTLSRKYSVTIIIVVLSMLQLSLNIYEGVEVPHVGHISSIEHSVAFKTGLYWISSTVLCDLTITCSMFYFLQKAKKSNPKPMKTMIRRLLVLTVETGLIITLFAVIELILFVTKRNTLLYTAFLASTSKLYSNTLLAILNSRIQIEGGRESDEDTMPVGSGGAEFTTNISWGSGITIDMTRTQASEVVLSKRAGVNGDEELGKVRVDDGRLQPVYPPPVPPKELHHSPTSFST